MTDPSDIANAKYVELYNASGSAIDFGTATWYLARQANGAGALANVQLSGSVAAGATFVIAYNTTYDSSYGETADQYNGTVITGNGDDSYWLVQGGGYGTGTVVDAYGVINQDGTGFAWEYTDSHAVRNSSIGQGSDTWTSSEWTITAAAVADMTPHAHTYSGGGGEPSFVAGYSNRLVGVGTSQSVTGLTAATAYYYRLRAENACGPSVNSSTATVTTVAATPSQTLRFTGFEGTASDNWSWTLSTAAVEYGPRATTNATGSYSLMLSGSNLGNVDPTVTFDNVKMPPSATAVSVVVAYACSGADTGDDLYLEVSYDNGGTWPVSTQLVDGASNLANGFTQTTAGNTAGSNPYALALPNNVTNVRVRIRYDEAAAGDNRFDEFYIDDVKLVSATDGMKTVAFSGTQTIQVETNTTAFNIPITISSAADATVRVAIAGTAQAGGTDFTATTTNIVFTAGGGTTANLQITLNNDSIAEGPESVRLTLTQADGCRVVGPDVHTLFIRDDDGFSLVAANLVNGTVTVGDVTAWGEAGQRLLRTLQPDIVAIQEWVITNASYQAFVDSNFGSGYYYVVDGVTGQYAIPNGIISRWPFLETNIWDDVYAGYREHMHARIDLPGPKDLNLVSVHLKAGDTAGDLTTRENQARAITNYVATANFGSSNYLAIAGDLNQTNRTAETVLTILGTIVSDADQPTTKSGSKNTNPADTRPYDFVLPDAALEAVAQAVTYNGTSFPEGLLFDTREWGDHQYPALAYDSRATNLTHRPVVKVFALLPGVTIDNTGTPAAGNIAAGAANAVIFGFRIDPGGASIDFTGLSLDTAGTATSSDLSNFEVIYDADNSGTYNGGDSVVSSAAQALGDPISFTIAGQSGFSAARRYLVIADVAAAPTAGRTITCNVAAPSDVTTTGNETGTAAGNAQTIITAPSITTPTATAIGQTAATLGATLAANNGATVTDYGVVWNTAGTPTTADNKVQESTTEPSMPDVFDVSASGLSQGTKIYSTAATRSTRSTRRIPPKAASTPNPARPATWPSPT